MNKKVETLHPNGTAKGREAPAFNVPTTRTSTAVRQFKSRAQLAQEKEIKLEQDSKIWLEDYLNKILLSYKLGCFCLDSELRQYFDNASFLFGETLQDINYHQDNNRRLYLSDINSLSLNDQFKKTVLCFLIDMDDDMIVDTMKKYLQRLKNMEGEDSDEVGDLIEYLDKILKATKELIQHQYLSIDTSFYDKLQLEDL